MFKECFEKKKKKKKKRKCLFGGTVPLKTNQYFFFFEPNVLCLGKENKKYHLRSFLTLHTLNWPGEFKASKVDNYVLYSHDVMNDSTVLPTVRKN